MARFWVPGQLATPDEIAPGMICLARKASAFMVNGRERMLSETHIWNGNLTCRNRQ